MSVGIIVIYRQTALPGDMNHHFHSLKQNSYRIVQVSSKI